MKKTSFGDYVSIFLCSYLPGQRNYSVNTIASYSDTFRLMLKFGIQKYNIHAERFSFVNFSCVFVENFMQWLQTERNCSPTTCNQRLAAINSFVKFLIYKQPEFLSEYQNILAIPIKRTHHKIVGYFTVDEMKAILKQPNLEKKDGLRDMAILCLLYDSGARVQELINLKVRDVRVLNNYTIKLNGKGNKTRCVPITANTAQIIARYIKLKQLDYNEKLDYLLFNNHSNAKFTRQGICTILKKYLKLAIQNEQVQAGTISPHMFRHSKAMHMYEADENLIYIRDFLGHEQVTTTEIYAKANVKMKREALEKAFSCVDDKSKDLPDWNTDNALMTILNNLCKPNN